MGSRIPSAGLCMVMQVSKKQVEMFHFPSQLRGKGHTAITKSAAGYPMYLPYMERWAGEGGVAGAAGGAGAGATSAWMAAANSLAMLLSMSRLTMVAVRESYLRSNLFGMR